MNRTLLAACAFVLAGSAVADGSRPPPLPYFQQAVPTCSLASVKGTYSFHSQGNYGGVQFGPMFNLPDALAGYVSFDGLGNVAAFYTTKVAFPAGNTWSANVILGTYAVGNAAAGVPTCQFKLTFCPAQPTPTDQSVWDAYFNGEDDNSFDFATIAPIGLTFAGKAEKASSKNLIPGLPAAPFACPTP